MAASYGRLTAQNAPAPGPASSAPEPSTAPEPTARTVQIDAIVTDRQGRPILNLRPADFEVTENGTAQAIEKVELTSRVVTPPAVGPVEPLPEPGGVSGPEEEERAAVEPGARVIAIYLDEFHVSAGASTERVRAAVSRFIDEQLRPRDLVAIMKPLDHLTAIRFTRDRDAARQAVASFNGRRDDYTPRTSFEEQFMGRSPEAVRTARSQIV